MTEVNMDKQFARILMLSVLLPAGASLAKAIDHDFAAATDSHQGVASPLAADSPAVSNYKQSIEGRRFMQVIATEEDAALRHHGVKASAQAVLVAGHRQ
jgi:hypothetical protein